MTQLVVEKRRATGGERSRKQRKEGTTVTPLILLYHFYWKRAHFIVLENKWFHVVSKNHIQNVNEPLSWVVLYQYPQEGNESYKHPVTLQSANHTCPHSITIRKINTFIWKVHTHMIGGLDVKCVHQNILNHCNVLYFSPSSFYIGWYSLMKYRYKIHGLLAHNVVHYIMGYIFI